MILMIFDLKHCEDLIWTPIFMVTYTLTPNPIAKLCREGGGGEFLDLQLTLTIFLRKYVRVPQEK